MDFVKQLMEQHGGALIGQLTGQLGFDAGQAQRFVPAAAERVMGAVREGKVSPQALLGGGAREEIATAVDTQALANEAGVDETTASAGLQSLLPTLLSFVQQQAGGAEGVLGLFGDKLGGAGGLAGKLRGLAGGFLKK